MTLEETLICDMVRGEFTSCRLSEDDCLEQLVKTAFRHNLHLILFDTLKKTSQWNRWPLFLRQRLKKEAATASVLDLIREQELRRVLMHLNEHGIQALLLKGVPIAYTLYQSPVLRPRGDTDLLIRDRDMPRLVPILRELGYNDPDIKSDKPSYACLYRRWDLFGADHNLDVHWKINDAQLFAKTFTFDELWADAIEIRSLASCARGLGYSHGLLLACMHLFGHAHAPFYVDGSPVYAGDHLRWVYDIHLLCSALSVRQWSEFSTLASTKRIAKFCLEGLNAAREAFNAQIPDETMGALQTAARCENANLQMLKASGAAWFLANVRALPDWRQRIALIKQTALPPSTYIMEKYRTSNRLALPFFYVFRSINGVFKLFKRSKFRNE